MRFLLPLLALTALSAPAAAEPADRHVTLTPLPDARVGRVAGTRAFIGLSLAGGRVRAYVCDGTMKRRPTIAKWFGGRWDGHGALTLVRGRHTLQLDSAEGGRLVGPDGTHAIRLRPATPPAGLYHRAGRPGGTWIALSRRRARGTFASPRPKRCVPVPVTGPGGTVEYKIVCR
jgi:hypothetical protein